MTISIKSIKHIMYLILKNEINCKETYKDSR